MYLMHQTCLFILREYNLQWTKNAVQTNKALAVGIESLSLDGGGTIDDLDLEFTLPGYPDIELKVSCSGVL